MMLHSQYRVLFLVPVLYLCTALAGCAPSNDKLASVNGVITLNGVPANAELLFQPIGADDTNPSGRASVGVAERNGRFQMYYTRDTPGALVGRHRVFLTVWDESGKSAGGGVKLARFEQSVKPGENRFHFAITY